ncbi:MAG: putative uridylyltransferase [Syntrophorhabdus sp. PtaU1.Bin058]|nr:MAG: putative uridylyltransferase [Syntrophorhabdus sp. PtaU1.Bin058]
MTEQELLRILQQYGQDHLADYYHTLPPRQKHDLLQKFIQFDIHLAFKVYKEFCLKKDSGHAIRAIEPPRVVTIPKNIEEQRKVEKARLAGEALIRQRKVAVLIVAGGQGSRLGYEGPKGTFRISPLIDKTLFQLFAEQVIALSRRYGVTIPLLIMTSLENDRETVQFFHAHSFFGLPPETVHFFQQGMLPTITPNGKLLLRNDGNFVVNPDGHGGSLKALHDSGLLKRLTEQGYEELFYCQVDNPLVKIADPVFLGLHAVTGADASTKVVRRQDIREKVGLYVYVNGRDAVVEYSDIGDDHMSAFDENGDILYWAGNTAIHIFSLAFIQRLTDHGFVLPYHCAQKSVEYIDHTGISCATDVWKFETFVFDAIPLAGRTCCMEVIREEEFAPVKNKEGNDSPETARKAMMGLHRNWLQKAGIDTDPDTKIEISPLFALDSIELQEKIKHMKFPEKKDIYIE